MTSLSQLSQLRKQQLRRSSPTKAATARGVRLFVGIVVALVAFPLPAQVNPEVGPNDFQISAGSSLEPAVAYSPSRGEYLVAWGEGSSFDTVVQRLDSLGSPLGGPIETGLGYSDEIQVTYDPVNDRFLVTINLDTVIAGVLVDSSGSVGTAFPITGDSESSFDVTFNPDLQEYVICRFDSASLWLRRVDANGQVIGLEDVEFGLITINDSPHPRITYNPIDQELFVVYRSRGDFGGDEVFAIRLGPTGSFIEFQSRISSIQSINQGASSVDVVHNAWENEYLAVWTHGKDDTATDGDEVFGQRLDSQGEEIGLDDFQISTMGRPGRPEADARSARVSFNGLWGRYLVVWSGDDYTGDMADNEFEVFGQHVSWGGGLLAPGNFRVSDFGPTGDSGARALDPEVAFSPILDEYLVVYKGHDLTAGTPPEIYGQRLYGAPTVFSDGFETGDHRRWSTSSR